MTNPPLLIDNEAKIEIWRSQDGATEKESQNYDMIIDIVGRNMINVEGKGQYCCPEFFW